MSYRKLTVFDSFEGLPDTDQHPGKNIFGGDASFYKGMYHGELAEVCRNIDQYGAIDVTELRKGWFEDTLPMFHEPVSLIFLDVDLADSTKTCLVYLYPLLSEGGILFSHDGHIPAVIDVFNDHKFWENEIGCPKPEIDGLGKTKLIKIIKKSIRKPNICMKL